MKHPHYKKPVAGLQFVDVYRVLALFGVTDPCLQHAVKKLLVAGGRGAKDISQDVQEAIDTLQRWQEMRAEDSAVVKKSFTTDPAMPANFGQQHTIEPALTVGEAVELGARPVGNCTACLTFAMPCTGACVPAKEPQQPRHRCLACAGGHATHQCQSGT